MLDTWEELTNIIEEGICESVEESTLLQARVNILLVKKQISFETRLEEIQSLLKSKFHVNHTLESIENELTVLKFNLDNQDILELEEDFFQGF